jgi:Zn-dependent protease
MEELTQAIQKITVFAIPLIFAITLHEAAHGYVAKLFGDNTAYMLGRITMNPIKHIDPLWTIAIPLLTLLFTPFVFGSAKPVPVNGNALRNPKRDMVFVAAAGPFANLLMMLFWAVVAKLALGAGAGVPAQFMVEVGKAGIYVNALLMVFNLIPLLPLDGGRVVNGLLPTNLANVYSRIEPYGMFILIALMMTPILGAIVIPLVAMSMKAVYFMLGLR